jgi:RNA polymerase sigma-70 factor (ECF subfamily)
MNVSIPAIVLPTKGNTGRQGHHIRMEFDEFYRENYARVYRTMILAFRDPGFSEEITQEAFYRALRRWSKVSKLSRPDAWTMVVALNCGRDGSRRRKIHEAKQPLLTQDHSGTINKEVEVDDQMAVVNLLASVSSRQREVLVLRYIAQLSVAEIAEAMKCAEGTVKSTLHTALERANQAIKGSIYAED